MMQSGDNANAINIFNDIFSKAPTTIAR